MKLTRYQKVETALEHLEKAVDLLLAASNECKVSEGRNDLLEYRKFICDIIESDGGGWGLRPYVMESGK